MSDTCKHCGAWHGLHHYETEQCPVGGVEAPIGRRQEWQTSTFEPSVKANWVDIHNLAVRIYDALNEKGAGLGNVAILIIENEIEKSAP